MLMHRSVRRIGTCVMLVLWFSNGYMEGVVIGFYQKTTMALMEGNVLCEQQNTKEPLKKIYILI